MPRTAILVWPGYTSACFSTLHDSDEGKPAKAGAPDGAVVAGGEHAAGRARQAQDVALDQRHVAHVPRHRAGQVPLPQRAAARAARPGELSISTTDDPLSAAQGCVARRRRHCTASTHTLAARRCRSRLSCLRRRQAVNAPTNTQGPCHADGHKPKSSSVLCRAEHVARNRRKVLFMQAHHILASGWAPFSCLPCKATVSQETSQTAWPGQQPDGNSPPCLATAARRAHAAGAPKQPPAVHRQRAHPTRVPVQDHLVLHLRGRRLPHRDALGRVAAEHLRPALRSAPPRLMRARLPAPASRRSRRAQCGHPNVRELPARSSYRALL